jgi:hypothetical protein
MKKKTTEEQDFYDAVMRYYYHGDKHPYNIIHETITTIAEAEHTDQWEYYGKYYGFPVCCINAFCNSRKVSKARLKAADGTGFIPCAKHAAQVNSGKIKLGSLVKNRICKNKFPVDLK